MPRKTTTLFQAIHYGVQYGTCRSRGGRRRGFLAGAPCVAGSAGITGTATISEAGKEIYFMWGTSSFC